MFPGVCKGSFTEVITKRIFHHAYWCRVKDIINAPFRSSSQKKNRNSSYGVPNNTTMTKSERVNWHSSQENLFITQNFLSVKFPYHTKQNLRK
jgi:hypothetical protein